MKGLFIFAAGLVAGAVAGAYLVKDKIMADAREEINEVREYYKSKKEEKQEEEIVEEKKEEVKEEKEYEEIVVNNGYVNYNKPEKIEQQTMLNNDAPYIIEPEDFGEEEEYDTSTLTYFADGVLIDDVDEVIEEADIVVGLDNLKIFEEYGASAIYVRNELYKTDFEILKDDWNYSDLQEPSEKKPHQL